MNNPPINANSLCPTRLDSRRDSRSRREGFDQDKLRLRNFKPNDLGALVEIDLLCFPAALAYTKEHLLGYLRHRSVTTFIAEYDQQIIGFVLLVHYKREKHIHLVTLDVIPQFQGLGVGKWLLGAVLQMAASVKVVKIQLEVAVTNQKAIDLYRTFGFRIT